MMELRGYRELEGLDDAPHHLLLVQRAVPVFVKVAEPEMWTHLKCGGARELSITRSSMKPCVRTGSVQ